MLDTCTRPDGNARKLESLFAGDTATVELFVRRGDWVFSAGIVETTESGDLIVSKRHVGPVGYLHYWTREQHWTAYSYGFDPLVFTDRRVGSARTIADAAYLLVK